MDPSPVNATLVHSNHANNDVSTLLHRYSKCCEYITEVTLKGEECASKRCSGKPTIVRCLGGGVNKDVACTSGLGICMACLSRHQRSAMKGMHVLEYRCLNCFEFKELLSCKTCLTREDFKDNELVNGSFLCMECQEDVHMELDDNDFHEGEYIPCVLVGNISLTCTQVSSSPHTPISPPIVPASSSRSAAHAYHAAPTSRDFATMFTPAEEMKLKSFESPTSDQRRIVLNPPVSSPFLELHSLPQRALRTRSPRCPLDPFTKRPIDLIRCALDELLWYV